MKIKNVILVTDGDTYAKEAVERASKTIGGHCISASAGNPTKLTGKQIIELINQAKNELIVVMVDDKGFVGMGDGERAMKVLLKDKRLNVLGVLAVSSNGKDCQKINIVCSITKEGKVVSTIVDKGGNSTYKSYACGDTLSILKSYREQVIVGIGDPGKMNHFDDVKRGAPITTKAFLEVIKRSEYKISVYRKTYIFLYITYSKLFFKKPYKSW